MYCFRSLLVAMQSHMITDYRDTCFFFLNFLTFLVFIRARKKHNTINMHINNKKIGPIFNAYHCTVYSLIHSYCTHTLILLIIISSGHRSPQYLYLLSVFFVLIFILSLTNQTISFYAKLLP